MIVFRLIAPILLVSFIAGCSVIDVRLKIDPAGGALTDSDACVYDFDRNGLWYLVFIHEEGLLAAIHRHNPGIHLFLDENGDIIFQCRCSGRGEVIDVMDRTMKLADGTVFLCDVEDGNARITQIPISAPKCDGNDPEAVARCVFDVSTDPRVARFLPAEVRARLAAQCKKPEKNKQVSSAKTSAVGSASRTITF